ncbi:CvpA family protein [Treponema brennaborense]|uniref:Colicin V production protein n=1 Tax=Treponema brennaborense (strain DSM 12168 / CIP 105900 / DD5/3) TaxID=906968 RepID=F4LKY3_TREBD|nr:CvpA family protein [Treponema brennaborense]AEE16580.1 Colicin V production protein [Treponema brennaborense DSM 12168]
MTFAFIDAVFAVIILACAINGTIKGFVAELFGKAAVILGLVVAVIFYGNLVPYVGKWISADFLAQVVSFVLIFIVTYLSVRIVQHFIGGFFQGDILSGLNRALGFFLGIAEGLIITAVVIILLYAQPWIDIDGLFRGSFFHELLKGFVTEPIRYVSERIT